VFVSVTTVDSRDRLVGEATLVGEEMETWLREVEGFEGLMIFFKEGTTLGITFWESEEAAQRARALRLQFLERITAMVEVKIETIDEYELAYSSLNSNVAKNPGPAAG
jgi:heme-degrading monooxygenase HmoA